MRIDHVVYGTADLDAAAARVQDALALEVLPGGRHVGMGTHNRIVPLGDGSYLELLAVLDPVEAAASPFGALVQRAIAGGDGLLAWAVAVEDVQPVATRIGTAISSIARQGMSARLTGVEEALTTAYLPFFIERGADRPAPESPAAITCVELAGDARRLEAWLGAAALPVRVVDGQPAVRAVTIGARKLRTG